MELRSSNGRTRSRTTNKRKKIAPEPAPLPKRQKKAKRKPPPLAVESSSSLSKTPSPPASSLISPKATLTTPILRDSGFKSGHKKRVRWTPGITSGVGFTYAKTEYDRSPCVNLNMQHFCNGCNDIISMDRFHCALCTDYDLCLGCFKEESAKHEHPSEHFILYLFPGSPFYQGLVRQGKVPGVSADEVNFSDSDEDGGDEHKNSEAAAAYDEELLAMLGGITEENEEADEGDFGLYFEGDDEGEEFQEGDF